MKRVVNKAGHWHPEALMWLALYKGLSPRNNSVFSCVIFGMVGVWLAMHGSIAATSASTKILTQAGLL